MRRRAERHEVEARYLKRTNGADEIAGGSIKYPSQGLLRQLPAFNFSYPKCVKLLLSFSPRLAGSSVFPDCLILGAREQIVSSLLDNHIRERVNLTNFSKSFIPEFQLSFHF